MFLLKNNDSENKKDLFLPIIHYEMFLRVFLIRCWCGKTFFSQDRRPLVFALNFCLEEHQLSEFKGQWVVTGTIWFDESGITRNKTVKFFRCRNQSSMFSLCHTRDISFPALKKRWIFCAILISFLIKLNLEPSFGRKDVEYPTFTIHLFKAVEHVEKSHFEI